MLGLSVYYPKSPRLYNYSLPFNFKRAEVVQESPPILLFKYLSIYIYEDFWDSSRLNPHGYWLADVRGTCRMRFLVGTVGKRVFYHALLHLAELG